MHQKNTYKTLTATFVKLMSVCILCVYALFPFGDFITSSAHRFSHAFESSSAEAHSHASHHHHTHTNHNQIADKGLSNHEHILINFLSAAFNYDSKVPNSQKSVTLSLDNHVLTNVLDFQPPVISETKFKIHSFFHPLIIRFSENTTPPPRFAVKLT